MEILMRISLNIDTKLLWLVENVPSHCYCFINIWHCFELAMAKESNNEQKNTIKIEPGFILLRKNAQRINGIDGDERSPRTAYSEIGHESVKRLKAKVF